MSTAIYQIKITLKDIKPPIWRRILISNTITLADFHLVIQTCMGWDNSHLFNFEDQLGNTYSVPNPWGELDDEDGSEVPISQVLPVEKSKLLYVYDFGDYWRHEITLEKIVDKDPKLSYPRCVKGKRACPPEDCGGIYGYMEVLEARQNQKEKVFAELNEWYNGYDPEAFDIEKINKDLNILKNHLKLSS